jgi:hypothetical protein
MGEIVDVTDIVNHYIQEYAPEVSMSNTSKKEIAMNKAREYSSPMIEELINETTPEELEKLSQDMENEILENQLRDELDKWESVHYRMQDEGIDYCFNHYSNWTEIKDEKFHELKQKLIDTMSEMWIYVHSKITETEDKIIELDNSNILE